MVSQSPYDHTLLTAHEFERTFSTHVQESELVWHRDHAIRQVRVMKGDKWQFQLDNQLPFELCVGDVFEIPAGVYHRLIKGDSDLKLWICEHEYIHEE